MVPPPAEANEDEFKNNNNFNPAMLPLPSYVSSSSSLPYQYLLVSRLVTSGTHQESHICFASICAPPDSPSHAPYCSDGDIELLGPAGGMRCVTRPEKVNIPATPAKKCTGAWKIFPDIPGFHDPRIFWSGRGEPLIEVNSGSKYGCIGLWIQDLRSVFEPLKDVLVRKKYEEKDENKREGQQTQSEVMDVGALGVRVGYSKLMELTRNPKGSRADVEKNWVVFFPSEDEMWVQYNAMGKPTNRVHQTGRVTRREFGATELSPSSEDADVILSSLQSPASIGLNDVVDQDGLQKYPLGNHSTLYEESLKRHDWASISSADVVDRSDPFARLSSTIATHKILPRNRSGSGAAADIETTVPPNHPVNPLPQPQFHPQSNNSPGRTLSQLLSHGLTTPNLASPPEPPCFNLTSPSHTTDPLNNTGHWHQGTNSLRLILCTRSAFRARTCIPNPTHNSHDPPSPPTPMTVTTHSNPQYEEHLRSEGAILHFSIIHRKFSNELDLPMRYERYILLWEARAPFRVVGVSKYPFVFGRERVRPWTFDEDRLGQRESWDLKLRRGDGEGATEDGGEDREEGGAAYFTYTPSLAWSYRARNEDEDEAGNRERGHEDLGTGYLGDEVIVGIGMDDVAQGFVRVGVGELLGCLRICPGV